MWEERASGEGVVEPRGLKQDSVDCLGVRKLGFGPLKNSGNQIEKI